jgi:hypothetical protein
MGSGVRCALCAACIQVAFPAGLGLWQNTSLGWIRNEAAAILQQLETASLNGEDLGLNPYADKAAVNCVCTSPDGRWLALTGESARPPAWLLSHY